MSSWMLCFGRDVTLLKHNVTHLIRCVIYVIAMPFASTRALVCLFLFQEMTKIDIKIHGFTRLYKVSLNAPRCPLLKPFILALHYVC